MYRDNVSAIYEVSWPLSQCYEAAGALSARRSCEMNCFKFHERVWDSVRDVRKERENARRVREAGR